jgi:cyclopropane fatty-acyl-phospholipid synthase-like methyltransferase
MALPWSVARLDADIAAWVDALKLPLGARVLDLGSGPGTAAIHFARQGFDVTATDISSTALAQAQERAGPLGQRIHWVAGDVFEVRIDGPFDLALDRGLFHVFPDELRAPYAERVAGWVKMRGRLLLKTFSELEPAGYGPRRVTRAEVRATFGPHFEEEAWQPSTFPGQLDHEPKAHLFLLRRR